MEAIFINTSWQKIFLCSRTHNSAFDVRLNVLKGFNEEFDPFIWIQSSNVKYVILIFFSLFVYGISLLLASLTVYFTDLENMWILFSQFLWFATPIFYGIEDNILLFIFNIFNPMYHFIAMARDIVIYQKAPELWMVGMASVYTFLAIVIGLFVFSKLKHKFAEKI